MLMYSLLLSLAAASPNNHKTLWFDKKGVCRFQQENEDFRHVGQVKIGWGGVDKARKKALEQAVSFILQEKCAKCSPAEKKIVQAAITPMQWDKDAKQEQVCVLVGVNRELLKDPNGQKKALTKLSQQLHALARSMSGKHEVLFLQPPFLTTGNCSAGVFADEVLGKLRGELLQNDQKIASTPSKSAKIIQFAVTPGKHVWTFEVKEHDGLLLGNLQVPSLFMSGAATQCISDSSNRLSKRMMRHSSGLDVMVDIGGQSTFCEGDKIDIDIQSNQPAHYQLYNIDAQGNAFLIWPGAGEESAARKKYSVGQVTAVPSIGGGAERLVVVAVPNQLGFGKMAKWQGLCRIKEKLGDLFPKDIAMHSLPFQVFQKGTQGCQQSQSSEQASQEVMDAPLCR